MDLVKRFTDFLTDERLLAHLIVLHVILAIVLIASVLLRRLLIQGNHQVVRLTGWRWLEGVGQETNRRIRTTVFWTTLGIMSTLLIAGAAYHWLGRDLRTDFKDWAQHLTQQQL